MCRILLVQSESPFSIAEQLKPFAELSKNSREFQGHGWGCSWLPDCDANPTAEHSTEISNANFDGKWRHYRNINPIWDFDFTDFGSHLGSTQCLLVHARSAFRDEGIAIENNMPFSDSKSVFIFNGELRGVKIKSEGRIGAERIYNYIRRMDKGDKHAALAKAVSIIEKRTRYIRAMNIIFSDGQTSAVSSSFSESPDYFQMHRSVKDGLTRVCSKPFPGESDWKPIPNHTTITT